MFSMVRSAARDRNRQARGHRPLPDSRRATVQEPSDRRVQKTCRALADALLELILEHGYEAITVQHIIDRADVGRSTFYTHFRDKEDLLASGFAALRAFLDEQRPAPTKLRPLAFSRGVIDHAYEEQRLFRAIVGRQSGRAIEKMFRTLVVDLVRADLVAVAPRAPNREATVQFIAGGFMAILVWWLEAPNPLDPAAIDAMFHRMVRPAVTALRTAA